ncbi:cobalamin biosynthesis protein [Williamsia sterculiae]|uniref:Cobalamin biosynthesis protein CobD n=1 Tax=Williamsia sterculiae TaxID=1344003 RepID=A0A1N7G946_9NOCA|nr:cobalamin biosynthesis protein [Williamsia sterculiae]SIS09092.1 adenosylcobinamide-phosphate synthase [Williamsia sterculiae]
MGLVAGYLADRVVGDPRRGHPVAGMGTAAAALERRLYRDSRPTGSLFTACCVAPVWAVGMAADRCAPLSATAVSTWIALGGSSLCDVGDDLATRLERGDVDGARTLIPSLCGRDPRALDETGLVRAAIESIAENTSDATVAPLFWAALGGAPAVLAYRMVNTLDAMVGHHSARYERFGWAAARTDDAANLLPARLTGLLTVLLAPDRAGALRAWRADAARHPSPNAGVAEATCAGALGIRLGGTTVYPHRVEERPVLGDGQVPTVLDLRAAIALSRRVQTASVLVGVGLAVSRRSGWRVSRAPSRRRSRRRRSRCRRFR